MFQQKTQPCSRESPGNEVAKNGLESVLLRNVNRINPNRLQLKQLIPLEHGDLRVKATKHSEAL